MESNIAILIFFKTSRGYQLFMFSKLILTLLMLFTIPVYAVIFSDPTDSNIKSWLDGKDILIKKVKLFPDKHEKIDVSKISNITKISKDSNVSFSKTKDLITVSFDYFSSLGIKVPCEASISYSWTTISYPPDKFNLENINVKCSPIE